MRGFSEIADLLILVFLVFVAIGLVLYGESQKPESPPCTVEVFSQNGELFETFTLSEGENPYRMTTCVRIGGRKYPPTWHIRVTPIQKAENDSSN